MIVGELVNSRYEIKMLIGDGGMANVYLAYDRILRKNVAIKMLRYELSKDESFIKRFNREAGQVTELKHPNIVSCYTVGDYKEQPFIVMEYIKGKTLKDYLKENPTLSEDDAVEIMAQICKGVNHAHKQGIIHRDLKSQNIMIGENLDVKIADFGIALSSNEADMTQTNTIMGSVHYLAPELARGNIATEFSDIYSLGILLYEILTKTVPFKGEGAVNIALQHLESEIPSVRLIDDALSPNFDLIIKKCTQKIPNNRYANVLSLLDDLNIAHVPGSVEDILVEEDDKTKILPKIEDEMLSDEKSEQETKMKKRINWLSVIIAFFYTILLTMVIVAYIVVVVIPAGYSTEQAIVPDVIGLTADDAYELFIEAGFDDVQIREVTNSAVQVGEIFRANPPVGARVRLVDDLIVAVYVASR